MPKLKIASVRIHKCYSCNKTKECLFEEDPYQAEINNDHTPVWECWDCRKESMGDI